MPSYAHNKLIQRIKNIDQIPIDLVAFNKWIEAPRHLQFLEENGREDEVVIYASGPYAFIHSMVVPNKLLSPPDEADWPVPGFEDTELGVLMEPEVGHGTTEVYAGVQV
jgi:hypothetical protein